MHHLPEEAAQLAASVARSVAERGVVCLGCNVERLTGTPSRTTLMTLSPPPLARPEIELGQLLLLVAFMPGAEGLDLSSCAAAGVPEVWLYDTSVGLLESLRLPEAGRYRQRSLILPGERTLLAALPDIELMPLSRGGPTPG